jgi:cytochrome c peroxidase
MRSFLLLVIALAFVIGSMAWIQDRGPNATHKQPILGNVETLRTTYAQWKKQNAENGGNLRVVLALNWSKGLSSEFTEASGTAAFDLLARTLKVEVSPGEAEHDTGLDVWLVENEPGAQRSVMPEKGDRMVRAGRLEPAGSGLAVETPIPAGALGDFELDLVVVTPADRSPDEGGLLFGTPDLFQRLYSRDMRVASGDQNRHVGGLLLAVIAPVPLQQDPPQIDPILGDLIAQGENLFFNETFAGNSRTCGTCHPAANNLTISAESIAALPNNDPLFVAEFVPALQTTASDPRRFEIPVLMREQGLILENVDGFGDLVNRFAMRGVPHTLGMNLSLTRPPGSLNPPAERTGWGGDGAPFDGVTSFGTLRDFATGAVRQHFTKTKDRVLNRDFRLPTDDELTAMEAFQRSLGRQAELDIGKMVFTDNEVAIGRDLFNSPTQGKCFNCHFNAGANVSTGTNNNFNTGVEQFLVNHPDGLGEPRPRDGGFGTNPQGTFTSVTPNADGSFGNKTFNTPPLVEAADTEPWFHNNITEITNGTGTLPDTIEGAVEFYVRPEFAGSPSGQFIGPIVLNATQIAEVGKFLRVINALENERNARTLAQAASAMLSSGTFDDVVVNGKLTVAIAECDDADEELEDVGLHHTAQQRFFQAEQKLEGAKTGPVIKRIQKIDEALTKLAQARADMVVE